MTNTQRLSFIGFLAVGLFSLPLFAQAASLGLSPSSTSVTVGKSFSVTARVNAGGEAINAAEGTIMYPTQLLKLTSVSKSGSIFTFWALEPRASSSGQVSFIGGLPHPGYTGSAGTIVRMTFTASATGTATISYGGGKVLADDGNGTNILSSQGSATVHITEPGSATPSTPAEPPSTPRPIPGLSSTTHPKQTEWLSKTAGTLQISKPSGSTGFSFVIDQKASTAPDESVDTTAGSIDVPLASDGVWYVHVRAKYATGWSNTTSYIFRRDTAAPQPFTVTVEQDRGVTDPTPTIVFSAHDVSSGIAGYTVSVDGGAPVAAVSPYQLSSLLPGAHRVLVVAVDQAGLAQTASADVLLTGYPVPSIDSLTTPIMLMESFSMNGLALAGDIVIIAVDGQTVGQTVAKRADTTDEDQVLVRVPWTYTSTMLLRPGTHTVTVTAVGSDGQRSVATDPRSLHVVGGTMMFRGRPVATIALAPAIGIGIILVLFLNAAVFAKLWWSVRKVVQRDDRVEDELEGLRQRIRHDRLTTTELDEKIQFIEADLAGRVRKARRRTGSRRGQSV